MKSHFLYFPAHSSDLRCFLCTFMVFHFCWPMNCIFLMVNPTWLFFKSISWLTFSWVARFFFSVLISDWYNSNSPIDLFNKPLNNILTDINRKSRDDSKRSDPKITSSWPQVDPKLTFQIPLSLLTFDFGEFPQFGHYSTSILCSLLIIVQPEIETPLLTVEKLLFPSPQPLKHKFTPGGSNFYVY